MTEVSLHDIAPRLAAARDVERWMIWCAGDEAGIKNGDHWAEIVGYPEHWTKPCPGCRGVVDRYRFSYRILHGCNRGVIVSMQTGKCRHPRSGCEWWSRG